VKSLLDKVVVDDFEAGIKPPNIILNLGLQTVALVQLFDTPALVDCG